MASLVLESKLTPPIGPAPGGAGPLGWPDVAGAEPKVGPVVAAAEPKVGPVVAATEPKVGPVVAGPKSNTGDISLFPIFLDGPPFPLFPFPTTLVELVVEMRTTKMRSCVMHIKSIT